MDGFSTSSFQDWFQQLSANYLQTKTQAQYDPQLQLAKLQLQQQSQNGQQYIEGKPVPGMVGISSSMLLLGGVALLAVMLMKD